MYEHFKKFFCATYVRWAHALSKLVSIGMLFADFPGSKTAPNSLSIAMPLGNIDIMLDTEMKLNPCGCTVLRMGTSHMRTMNKLWLHGYHAFLIERSGLVHN